MSSFYVLPIPETESIKIVRCNERAFYEVRFTTDDQQSYYFGVCKEHFNNKRHNYVVGNKIYYTESKPEIHHHVSCGKCEFAIQIPLHMTPQKDSQETPQETPEETPEETPQGTPQKDSQETDKGTVKDVRQENPDSLSQEEYDILKNMVDESKKVYFNMLRDKMIEINNAIPKFCATGRMHHIFAGLKDLENSKRCVVDIASLLRKRGYRVEQKYRCVKCGKYHPTVVKCSCLDFQEEDLKHALKISWL